MKKLVLLVLLVLSGISHAYLSDYEIVLETNKFMTAKCRNFNTMNAENKDLESSKKFLVVYAQGWAKVGINERPPHDDSGKTTNELVVYNYSCR